MTLHLFRMIGHKHLELAVDPGNEVRHIVHGAERLFAEKRCALGPIHVRVSPVMAATTFDFLGESK
jgi:hypothetical protein